MVPRDAMVRGHWRVVTRLTVAATREKRVRLGKFIASSTDGTGLPGVRFMDGASGEDQARAELVVQPTVFSVEVLASLTIT